MRQRQSGFTMIELIMVIVILGILAAIAMPRFVDLSGQAKDKAFQGVRGAAASAMAINYASCAAVSNASSATGPCREISNCSQVATLLQGGLPTDYSVASVALTGNGTEGTCTLSLTGYAAGSNPTTFTGIGAGQ